MAYSPNYKYTILTTDPSTLSFRLSAWVRVRVSLSPASSLTLSIQPFFHPEYQMRIGESQHLAFSDSKIINLMYKCNEKCGKNPGCKVRASKREFFRLHPRISTRGLVSWKTVFNRILATSTTSANASVLQNATRLLVAIKTRTARYRNYQNRIKAVSFSATTQEFSSWIAQKNAARGLCKRNVASMKKRCPLACGYCQEIEDLRKKHGIWGRINLSLLSFKSRFKKNWIKSLWCVV